MPRDESTYRIVRAFSAVGFAQAILKTHKLGIGIVLVCLSVGFAFLHNATFQYEAQLIVVPSEQGTAAIPSGLSSLGSLVGAEFLNQRNSAFTLYAEALYSIPVSEALSQDQEIMRGIFFKQWNPASAGWSEPQSLRSKIVRIAKGAMNIPKLQWEPPGANDLNRFIREKVQIAEDKRKPVLRITFEFSDRQFAARLLQALNTSTDRYLRSKVLARAEQNIAYLEARLARVTIAEYRQVLAENLAQNEKSRMLASASASYAADSLGGVLVSKNPTSPNPLAVLALSALVGVVVWILTVLVNTRHSRDVWVDIKMQVMDTASRPM